MPWPPGQLGPPQDRAVPAEHHHQLAAGGRGRPRRPDPRLRVDDAEHRLVLAGSRDARSRTPTARRPRRGRAPEPRGGRVRHEQHRPGAHRCSGPPPRSSSLSGAVTSAPPRPLGRSPRARAAAPPAQPHEVLDVPARPRQRAGDDPGPPSPSVRGRCRDPTDRPDRSAGSRTTPPAPTRPRPTSNCGLTISTQVGVRRAHRGQRRQHQGQRDERQVGHHQVGRERQVAGRTGRARWSVRAPPPAGRAQPPRQLPVPDVHGDHPGRAPAQQHLGEAAGRGTGVQGEAPGTDSPSGANRSSAPISLCAPRET